MRVVVISMINREHGLNHGPGTWVTVFPLCRFAAARTYRWFFGAIAARSWSSSVIFKASRLAVAAPVRCRQITI